jgi:diadenosine tetraphosphatase ApaH/serine/threonine PP2A family protein phosphatase
MRARLLAVICLALAAACKGRDAAPPPTPAPPAPSRTACSLADVPARRPAPARLVAIGDLHGDATAARNALRLAGAIDDRDRWIGGALVVVQLGDVLDRGDGERDILDLFAHLELDARAAGGALIPLLGNHELMNAAGDFRYVTSGGFSDFVDAAGVMDSHADVAAVPSDERARAAALFPGGPYAHRLAGHLVIAIVGDTLFVHGGLSPQWATRIEDVNRSARCWLDGAGPRPDVLTADDGPVWSRAYAGDQVDCDDVARALAVAGAKRMVIAHTVQPNGISSACDGAVWRIDVGLAALYGGPLEALEIDHDEHGDRVHELAKP